MSEVCFYFPRYAPILQFLIGVVFVTALLWISKPSVSHTEEEALSVSVFSTTVSYWFCACLCRHHSVNPSVFVFLPLFFFVLCCLKIRPCRLSEFALTRPHAWISTDKIFNVHSLPTTPPSFTACRKNLIWSRLTTLTTTITANRKRKQQQTQNLSEYMWSVFL